MRGTGCRGTFQLQNVAGTVVWRAMAACTLVRKFVCSHRGVWVWVRVSKQARHLNACMYLHSHAHANEHAGVLAGAGVYPGGEHPECCREKNGRKFPRPEHPHI